MIRRIRSPTRDRSSRRTTKPTNMTPQKRAKRTSSSSYISLSDNWPPCHAAVKAVIARNAHRIEREFAPCNVAAAIRRVRVLEQQHQPANGLVVAARCEVIHQHTYIV